MAFDEEELDPHGECSAEIDRLNDQVKRLNGDMEKLRKANSLYLAMCQKNVDLDTCADGLVALVSSLIESEALDDHALYDGAVAQRDAAVALLTRNAEG